MLHLSLFCASVSTMCPKVIACLLYAISAYESFHRNAALFREPGNLYLAGHWIRTAQGNGMILDKVALFS